MSGGAWEYVASYITNGNASLSTYGWTGISTTANANPTTVSTAYATAYPYNNTSDSNAHNYAAYKSLLSTTRGYGDAILETSANGSSTNGSWFGDYSAFPYTTSPFFDRRSALTCIPPMLVYSPSLPSLVLPIRTSVFAWCSSHK